MKKLLSIILPTYNRIEDLKVSLTKLLKVIDSRCIIIISDNNSLDETWQYLKKIKKKNIKLYRQKKNIGSSKNYFFCLSKVKTKYAMFASDDDIIFGDYIKNCLDILESSKKISIVFNFKKKINKENIFFENNESNIAKIYNLSATAIGMCFRMDKNILKNFPTQNKNLYPQLKLFLYLSTLGNFIFLNRSGFRPIKKKPLTNYYWNYLDRPDDFGLEERIFYLKNKKFSNKNFVFILRSLASWGYNIMNFFPKEKKNKYIDEFIRIFSKYLILYPFLMTINHLNKKRFLIFIKNLLITSNYKFYLNDLVLFLKENIYSNILYSRNLIYVKK